MAQWEGNRIVGGAPGQTGGSGMDEGTTTVTVQSGGGTLTTQVHGSGGSNQPYTYKDQAGNLHVVQDYSGQGGGRYDTVVGGFYGGYSGSGFVKMGANTLGSSDVQGYKINLDSYRTQGVPGGMFAHPLNDSPGIIGSHPELQQATAAMIDAGIFTGRNPMDNSPLTGSQYLQNWADYRANETKRQDLINQGYVNTGKRDAAGMEIWSKPANNGIITQNQKFRDWIGGERTKHDNYANSNKVNKPNSFQTPTRDRTNTEILQDTPIGREAQWFNTWAKNVDKSISDWQASGGLEREFIGGAGKTLLGVAELVPQIGIMGASFIPGVGNPKAAFGHLIDIAPPAVTSIPAGLYDSFANPISEKGWKKGLAEDAGQITALALLWKAPGLIKGAGEKVKVSSYEIKPEVGSEPIIKPSEPFTLWGGIQKAGQPIIGIVNTLKEKGTGIFRVSLSERSMIDLETQAAMYEGRNVNTLDVARYLGYNPQEIKIPIYKVVKGMPTPEQLPDFNLASVEMRGKVSSKMFANPEIASKYGIVNPDVLPLQEQLALETRGIKSKYTESELPTDLKSLSYGGATSSIEYFKGRGNPRGLSTEMVNIREGIETFSLRDFFEGSKETFRSFSNIKSTFMTGIESSKELFRRVPEETATTIGMNKLKQIYGSAGAYNQINPEYREYGHKPMLSLPSDYDVQLKGSTKYAEQYSKILASKLQYIGEPVQIKEGSTTIIKKDAPFNPKLNILDDPMDLTRQSGETSFQHYARVKRYLRDTGYIDTSKLPNNFVDIHAGKITQLGNEAPESVFGMQLGREGTVKMSDVPTQVLSDQMLNKIASTSFIKSFTKAQLKEANLYDAFNRMYGDKEVYTGAFPELHRMKDIAHIQPTGYSLAESVKGSKAVTIKTLTDSLMEKYGEIYKSARYEPEPPRMNIKSASSLKSVYNKFKDTYPSMGFEHSARVKGTSRPREPISPISPENYDIGSAYGTFGKISSGSFIASFGINSLKPGSPVSPEGSSPRSPESLMSLSSLDSPSISIPSYGSKSESPSSPNYPYYPFDDTYTKKRPFFPSGGSSNMQSGVSRRFIGHKKKTKIYASMNPLELIDGSNNGGKQANPMDVVMNAKAIRTAISNSIPEANYSSGTRPGTTEWNPNYNRHNAIVRENFRPKDILGYKNVGKGNEDAFKQEQKILDAIFGRGMPNNMPDHLNDAFFMNKGFSKRMLSMRPVVGNRQAVKNRYNRNTPFGWAF